MSEGKADEAMASSSGSGSDSESDSDDEEALLLELELQKIRKERAEEKTESGTQASLRRTLRCG